MDILLIIRKYMDILADNLYLILAVMIGIVCLIGIFMHMKPGFGIYNIKVYGLTTITVFVAILALSGNDSAALSPAYGILGAVGGYLFGLKPPNNDDDGKQ